MVQIKALIKFILSFFKNNWEINDYPIRLRLQKNAPDNSKYFYQIINWWTVTGLGATKEEAFNNLITAFNDQVMNKGYKPRPGKEQKIKFVSTSIIDENYELVEHFLKTIIGFKEDSPVFISDESSLWDFTFKNDINKYYDKIKNVYKIDLKEKNIDKIADIILIIKKNRLK